MSENTAVLVFCEVTGNKLTLTTTELLGAGSRLASSLGKKLGVVLIGNNVAGLTPDLIACGADNVYLVDEPLFKEYLTESYLIALEKVIQQTSPEILLLGQTAAGRDLAPWLAFHLNTGATMDCIALEIEPDNHRLLMTRPVYGGNALAIQVCDSNPQIAAVRPKAVMPGPKDSSRQGQVIKISMDIDPSYIQTRIIERNVETTTGIKLEEARVVVAGGRGMGSAAGFKQLEETAKLFKGAVGATRSPCKKNWIADSQQIGLTGKIVSPDLYLAVGLSGASQHLSGFSNAKVIVAINKDPEANIFKVAHYGIVADWKAVLPAFNARLKELI